MNSILTFVTGIKTYLIVGFTCLFTGFAAGGYVAYDYTSTKKDNEVLILATSAAKEREAYSNKLVEKERQNASTTTTLNTRIEQLNAEKSKILDSLSRAESIRNGMLNAKCESGKQENRTSSGSTNASETATSYCKLNKDAESALFGYIKQVEELNVYSQAAYEYVKAVEEQRQRMIKEQQ